MKNNILTAAAVLLAGLSGFSFAGGPALSGLNLLASDRQQAAPVPAAVPAPEIAKSRQENWRHVRLVAADGTVVTVDYSVLDLVGSVIAAPVWVNVEGRNLGNVRVVLLNYYAFQNGPLKLQDTQQTDLKYAGGTRFTGQFQKVLMSEGTYMYGGNLFRQELSVVVNGKWLRDPISNTNNFKFQMVR